MNQFNSRSEQNRSTPSLPIWKLLAFTVAGFITIMTEIIPAGLLALISHDLEVSEALAGQMISVYALGSVIAAIPVCPLRHEADLDALAVRKVEHEDVLAILRYVVVERRIDPGIGGDRRCRCFSRGILALAECMRRCGSQDCERQECD